MDKGKKPMIEEEEDRKEQKQPRRSAVLSLSLDKGKKPMQEEEEEDHKEQEQPEASSSVSSSKNKGQKPMEEEEVDGDDDDADGDDGHDDDGDGNEEEEDYEEQEQQRPRLRPYDDNDFIPFELFSEVRHGPCLDLVFAELFSSSEAATPHPPPPPSAPSSSYPTHRPFSSLPSPTSFFADTAYFPATRDGAGPSNLSPYPCQSCERSVEREISERYEGWVAFQATTADEATLLWGALEEESEEDVEMIMTDVIQEPWALMEHHEGSRLFQRLVELCMPSRRMTLVAAVLSHPQRLLRACCNHYGAKAMQKLVSSCTLEEEFYMLDQALNNSLLSRLCLHSSGHFVVIALLEQLPSQLRENAFGLMTLDFLELAMNQHGCSVLQKCVDYCADQANAWIFHLIETHALELAQDDYSNYVVQKVLQVIEFMASRIIRRLSGNFVLLSIQKCSSNVVEKCISFSKPEEFTNIIKELFSSSQILDVLENPYGNYVIQRAIEKAEGRDFEIIDQIISENETSLSSNIYARNVVRKSAARRKVLGRDYMKIRRDFNRKY